MKTNWSTKKLGEICEIARGGSPRPIKDYLTDSDDGINWIKISDATSSTKYIKFTKQKITSEGLHKTRLVKPGDLILTNSMSFGHPYIMKTGGAIHDGWLVLHPNKSLLDEEYLYYLLTSPQIYQQFNQLAAGAVVQNLNSSLVRGVEIPLPPLEVQKKIVAKLESVLAKISEAKKLRAEAQESAENLLSAELHKIFEEGKKKGWEEKELKDIGEIQTGNTPKTSNKNFYGDFIPFIKPSDIDYRGDGAINYENFALSEEGIQVARTTKPGSTLMVCIGASIGKTGYVDREVAFNQQINSISPTEEHDPKFVYYALMRRDFFKMVINNSSQTTLPIINKSKWENLKIPVPYITEQKKIVARLDSISEKAKQLQEYQKTTSYDLIALEQSILSKAFSGEFV